MHFLDLIMYFVCVFILWGILALISGGEYTNELGGLIGMLVVIIFTVIYIILFAIAPDWNWVDFNFNFSSIQHFFKW